MNQVLTGGGARERSRSTSTSLDDRCGELLASEGPMAVLGYLNSRTRFRFTGLYQADPPQLRNLLLFDRENPQLNVSGEVCPLEATYCSLVWGAERAFHTRDAARDERLASHPARETVISYCGVPIRRANGLVWGTLCHFDVRPRLVPTREVPVLESAAAIIAAWLDSLPTAS